MTKRYKIRKEQLERVVESFVMESAAPEAKKHVQGYSDKEDESLGMRTGKESGKKQGYKARREDSYGKWGKRGKHAPEAKKHKLSMGGEQSDDSGDGMKKPSVMKTTKMKHAPEAKKHVKGSVSESKKKQIQKIKKFMLEHNISETELEEGIWGDVRKGLTGHESGEERDNTMMSFMKELDKAESEAESNPSIKFNRGNIEKEARENNYKGHLRKSRNPNGVMYYTYKSGTSSLEKMSGGVQPKGW